LVHFYRTTQPTGIWGPVVKHLAAAEPGFRKEPFGRDALHLVVGLLWLGAMYVGPSYAVARQWAPAVICGIVVVIGSLILATSWRRTLKYAS